MIGILPLMLFTEYRGYGHQVRYLHFIGYRRNQRWNDWMDIIAIRKEEVIRAALEYLQDCQYLWEFVDLWDLPEDSDTIMLLENLAKRLGFVLEKKKRVTTSPYMPTISDWETYYQVQRLGVVLPGRRIELLRSNLRRSRSG